MTVLNAFLQQSIKQIGYERALWKKKENISDENVDFVVPMDLQILHL